MEPEIISNDELACHRAINAMGEVTRTRLSWTIKWLTLMANKQVSLNPVLGLHIHRDLQRYFRLQGRLMMLSCGIDPESRTPPERLRPWRGAPNNGKERTKEEAEKVMRWNLANAVRGPKPGEFDKIIRELEGLFKHVTPPPAFPRGGGLRKVA
jgi:hypothetical protein